MTWDITRLVCGPPLELDAARQRWHTVLDSDPAATTVTDGVWPERVARVLSSDADLAHQVSRTTRQVLTVLVMVSFLMPIAALALSTAPFPAWWAAALIGNLVWLAVCWHARLQHVFPLPQLEFPDNDTTQPWGPMLMERSLRADAQLALLSSLIHLLRLTAYWTGAVLLCSLLSYA